MRALMVWMLLASTTLGLGCAPRETPPEQRRERDAWVVVSYDVSRPDQLMTGLLDTELAADRALRESGAGVIDGNEVGQGDYELYFVGHDPEEMWRILEPVLAGAPLPWSRVELRQGLDDQDPQVLLP